MKFDLKSLLIAASIGASAIEGASIRRSNEVAQNSPLNIVRRTPGKSYGEAGYGNDSNDYGSGHGHGHYGGKGHLKDKIREKKGHLKGKVIGKVHGIKDRLHEKKNKYGKHGKGGYGNSYNPPEDNYGSVDPIEEYNPPKDNYGSTDPIEEYNPPKDNGYTSYSS